MTTNNKPMQETTLELKRRFANTKKVLRQAINEINSLHEDLERLDGLMNDLLGVNQLLAKLSKDVAEGGNHDD